MSKQTPNDQDITDAHWKGCAPGLAPEEPVYITQKISGQPNDPDIGRTN